MGAKRPTSRKQSSTSAHYQKQLEQSTFYLERSLGAGKIIVEALRKAGLKLQLHDKWFRHDTPDEVWLAKAGEEQWIVLMRDKKIARRPLELEALFNGGVKAFALVSGQLKDAENARIIVRAMPRILAMVRNSNFPFIAKIHTNSSVEMWKAKPIRLPKTSRRKSRKK